MIKINLLPFRAARSKELINRQIFTFIGTLIIVTGLLVLGHTWISKMVKGKQIEVDNIKQQVAKFEAINKEINEIKRQLDLLQKKTEVINNLEKNRRHAVHTMEVMTDEVLEGRMWLTSLETKVTEQKPPPSKEGKKGKTKSKKPQPPPVPLPPIKSVSLQGLALDNKTVADFMTRLEQAKPKTDIGGQASLFSRVKLKTLKKHLLESGLNLKQFNLDLTETMPKSSTTTKKASQ